jgi:hypothetical protein
MFTSRLLTQVCTDYNQKVHWITALTLVDPTADIDPLEREIRELAESMSAVKDEQEYIVIRERQHRDSK